MSADTTSSCDPQDLIAASTAFQKLRGVEPEVVIYLLNQLLDTPKTVQEILNGSRCMKCIPPGMQLQAQTYLLCQILNEQAAA